MTKNKYSYRIKNYQTFMMNFKCFLLLLKKSTTYSQLPSLEQNFSKSKCLPSLEVSQSNKSAHSLTLPSRRTLEEIIKDMSSKVFELFLNFKL